MKDKIDNRMYNKTNIDVSKMTIDKQKENVPSSNQSHVSIDICESFLITPTWERHLWDGRTSITKLPNFSTSQIPKRIRNCICNYNCVCGCICIRPSYAVCLAVKFFGSTWSHLSRKLPNFVSDMCLSASPSLLPLLLCVSLCC